MIGALAAFAFAVALCGAVSQARPDVLLAGPRGMRTLHEVGKVSAWHPYASNSLAILVCSDNPLHVASLREVS